MKRLRIILPLAIGLLATTMASAQPSGYLGPRVISAYWIETSAFLAVRPTTPYANPTGCTSSSLAIIPASHSAYKQLLAAVMLAKETGRPLQLYALGCYAAWGETFPNFYAAGPDW